MVSALVSGSGPGMCRWYWRSTTSAGLYDFWRASKATSAATHGGHCAPVKSSITATRFAALSLRPTNVVGLNGGTVLRYSASSFASTFSSDAATVLRVASLFGASDRSRAVLYAERTRDWYAAGSASVSAFVSFSAAAAAE